MPNAPRRPVLPRRPRQARLPWALAWAAAACVTVHGALARAEAPTGEPAPTTIRRLIDAAQSDADAGRLREAEEGYAEAARRAAAAGDPAAAARSAANAARLAERDGRSETAVRRAETALAASRPLPPSAARAETLLSVGTTLLRALASTKVDSTHTAGAAHEALSLAASDAAVVRDLRTASAAEGLLGALYERGGRDDEALEMTRRALLTAQSADALGLLARWHAQLGRLHRRAGRSEEALVAYRTAVSKLRAERGIAQRSRGPSDGRFEEDVTPLYLGLVDLLLARSDSAAATDRIAWLREARVTVEQFKVAELRDYYRDGCVEALEARARPLEDVSPSAAVLYPIVLPDRLELLVSLGDEMHRVRVDVSSKDLAHEVQALRHALEKRSTREFLPHARRLHARLVAPILPFLEGKRVDTLVFVPDGLLRTIPLAALHDDTGFVMERFAVATSPGLLLTEPRALDRARMSFLLAGVSEPREGFPALPHVREELEEIGGRFGGTVMLDDAFRVEGVAEKLDAQDFDVVHIASHGEFSSEAGRSFLLAGDGRLALDTLEEAVQVTRFRDRPVELLTLTACETAADDPRSALGLAGVAVKAGARSALGSLWRVEDRATAALVSIFYRELADPSVSRAEALRRGQRALLAEPRTAHPGYWAPFLLISSWL